MNNTISNAFKDKNGATRYTHIKVGRDENYFTNDRLNGDNNYTANDICEMVEFLVDNIYAVLWTAFSTASWHSYGKKLCLINKLIK